MNSFGFGAIRFLGHLVCVHSAGSNCHFINLLGFANSLETWTGTSNHQAYGKFRAERKDLRGKYEQLRFTILQSYLELKMGQICGILLLNIMDGTFSI
jgi:hypothetical protein